VLRQGIVVNSSPFVTI
jgi:hypothetical protein